MKKNVFQKIVWTCLMLLGMPIAIFAQHQLERLNRGVSAIYTSGNALVSWRIFANDDASIAFNVYASVNGGAATKQNSTPISGKSNYKVTGVSTSNTNAYFIKPVINGTEGEASNTFTLQSSSPYYSVDIDMPAGGTTPDNVAFTYSANDCSIGDLDGDGQYEIILKWDPSNSKDNSYSGYTGNVIFDAYTLSGQKLWRIDLGINIRAGAHYTQFMVYDLDGDGKAEIACKTAPGTKDASGNYISRGPAASASHTTDYRNTSGRILSGPEYLTIFNGQTGEEITTTYYTPRRHPNTENPTGTQLDDVWGDNYGNRVDRFLACVAYLDGERPSLVMCRGYYTRTVLAAYDFRGGQLTERWVFDSDDTGNSAYAGQGNHNLSVTDVDEDGKDEIIYGQMAIDDDGSGLYSTGLGHGDAIHVSNFDPSSSGIEIFTPHEHGGHGVSFRDAETGSILWDHPKVGDIGRGVAFDIDPNYAGAECWASDGAGIYSSTNGQVFSTTYPQSTSGAISYNAGIWWDGDLLRELFDRKVITKWNWTSLSTNRLLTAYNYAGATTSNDSKYNPALIADIWGDWREELIMRSNTNDKLLIFCTSSETEYGLYTLMHDKQYRLSIAWQNVGYNQPAHTSFFLGYNMDTPPVPDADYIDANHPFLAYSYTQTNDATGLVVMPAENFSHSFIGTNNDYWTKQSTLTGYTGTGYVESPDIAAYTYYTTAETDAPKLSFDVNFTKTGSHYIWAYVNFSDGASDSFYYGIDGDVEADNRKLVTSSYNNWRWVKGAQAFSVPSTGQHAFDILMRETGAKVDKIILTTDNTFNPNTQQYSASLTEETDDKDITGANQAAAKDGITIQSSDNRVSVTFTAQPGIITIYDVAGHLIETKKAQSNRETLILPNKGVYVIKVATSNLTKTEKIIIN